MTGQSKQLTQRSSTPLSKEQALFQYTLRLGDNALVLGHRLSEWCGHGPFLEEDVGVINTALDLLGQARMFLSYAGEIEGKGRCEDKLAYFRDERDWRNALIMEQPKGDFGYTTARQFLVDAYNFYLYQALSQSSDETIAAIAAKSLKETRYHLRHTSEWMLRLGDGTEESHSRVQNALTELWRFTEELFDMDEVDQLMLAEGIGVDLSLIKQQWSDHVDHVLAEATLQRPEDGVPRRGGRQGFHTEHMGYLLAEMQFIQRSYPGQQW